jgi:hypothetical protein
VRCARKNSGDAKRRKFMKRWTALGITLLLVTVGIVWAESLRWIPPTTYVDNSVIEPGKVLTFKVRTDEPNYVSPATDNTGKYYVGEIVSANSWPSDDEIDKLFQGMGHEGQTFTLTVTAGYIDNTGTFIESVPSGGIAYAVPFVPGKAPAPPTGLQVN